MAISHANGIAVTGISHLQGIAKTTVSAINGVTATFSSGVTTALPNFIRSGTSGVGTGDITPTLPSAWNPDDIFLLFVETNNEAVTAPAGWTEAPNSPASNSGTNPTRLTVLWRRAVAGDTAPTITDPGDHAVGQMFSVRGCLATGDPWDVTASSSGGVGTSVTIPGGTTTVNNCLIVLAASTTKDGTGGSFSGQTNSDLTSIIEILDTSDTSGTGGGFAVAIGDRVTAGTYGTTAVTQTTAVEWAAWSGALKPATDANPFSIFPGSANNGTGNVTLAMPLFYKENDILVMLCETNNENVGTPAGWTLVANTPVANAGFNPTRLTVFWKRASVSESSVLIGDPGDHFHGQVLGIRKCITTGDPWDVTASDTGNVTTAITTPGVTTTVNNALVLAVAVTTRDAGSNVEFSGWTNAGLARFGEVANFLSTSGTGGGFGAAVGNKLVAGAVGTTAVNQTTGVEWASWTGALKPIP